MPIKIYRPITPGRRHSSVSTFEEITKHKPEKSLIMIKKQNSGRNFQGKITVRHRGGGVKQYIRLVDYKGDKYDMPAKVMAIEYDPNRLARIALVQYKDGEKRYIIAPVDLKVDDFVVNSKSKVDVKIGNRMPLEFIPIGLLIHNVELTPGQGGELARSAGSVIKLMAIEGNYANLKMPSSEIRMVSKNCMASIGQVGNPEAMHIRWGKAGRMRLRGIRPTVRGKAMNPVDHPHGGGEGSHPIGMTAPKTLWGKKALGVHTRKKGKYSNKFIVSRRKNKNQ